MVWSLTFVILMEVTVERRRGLTGGLINIGWNIGAMAMTLSAFALRSGILFLKHDSRILRQLSNPLCGSGKSQASSPSSKQHTA